MRVYAIREDDGTRVLVLIRCDSCPAEVKPYPEIAASGWQQRGTMNSSGTDSTEQHYCPRCST